MRKAMVICIMLLSLFVGSCHGSSSIKKDIDTDTVDTSTTSDTNAPDTLTDDSGTEDSGSMDSNSEIEPPLVGHWLISGLVVNDEDIPIKTEYTFNPPSWEEETPLNFFIIEPSDENDKDFEVVGHFYSERCVGSIVLIDENSLEFSLSCAPLPSMVAPESYCPEECVQQKDKFYLAIYGSLFYSFTDDVLHFQNADQNSVTFLSRSSSDLSPYGG